MTDPDTTGAQRWLREGQALLERITSTQATAIEEAARWCADTIAAARSATGSTNRYRNFMYASRSESV